MNEATSGLIDIIEPTAPTAATANFSLIWLAGALALLLIVISAIWWRRQRCQRATRKRLQQLRHALLAGNMSQQDIAYELARELAQIFKLKQRQADAPPSVLPHTEYVEGAHLIASLDKLRYQADSSIDAQVWTRLFTIAESTLRWSGRC